MKLIPRRDTAKKSRRHRRSRLAHLLGRSFSRDRWFRSLRMEPLEIRLPLASDALSIDAAERIEWQGHDVEVHRGQWIVHVKDTPGSSADHLKLGPLVEGTDARVHAAAIEVGRPVGSRGHYLFEFGDTLPPDLALDVLSRTPGLQYAEPNFVLRADVVPDDPDFALLWGLDEAGDHDIDAPEAWELTTGSSSVVVGVIDTGVDYTHEDLAANIWTNPAECPAGVGTCVADGVDDDGNGYVDDFYGWDFADDDNDPFDDHSHGTHVAGTIAAAGNNGTGVVGVNWNAQIMALRFIGSSGSGSTSDAIRAIEYATKMKRDHGVNIPLTNNSWGGGGFSQALKDAIDESGQEGMLFVASAGNDSIDTDLSPHYPSSYDSANIISVASTTSTDGVSSFSNTGLTSVDLGAPGSDVWSTEPYDQYDYKSGTSMASPHVSGVAALAWAANPGATHTEVRDAVLGSVDVIPALQGKTVTGGRLNALGTLQRMGLFATPVSPAENEVVSVTPTSFTLDFSDPIDTLTVDASDFSVGGTAATGLNIVDSDTVEFTFSTSPVSVEGPQTLELAADSILRSSDGDGVAPLSRTFYYDPTPLGVSAITPADGSVLTLPDPILRLDFSEALATGSVGVQDLTLSAGRVDSATVIDADTVDYRLTNLDFEAPLTLTLPAGAVVDSFGLPNQSFAASFTLDFGTISYPAVLTELPVLGSMMYQSSLPGELHTTTDTDNYTIELAAGQTLSAVLTPSTGLAGRLRILDPSSNELATSTGSAGQTIVLQSEPIITTGVHTIVVESDGATSGTYNLELYLNVLLEDEHHGGGSNESLSSAQDASPGWTDVDPPVSRLGVQGWLSSGADIDWFELSLLDSQSHSLALQPISQTNVAVTLHADDGSQVAAGIASGDAVYIHDFVPATSGSYYVQIAGDAGQYTLTATRGASLDNDSNDSLGSAQDIGGAVQVLGHVGRYDPTAQGVTTSGGDSVGRDASQFTLLADGITLPSEWLEGAVVQENDGNTKVTFDQPRDPRVLMGALPVSEHFVSIDSDPEGDLTRDVLFTADGSKFLVAHRDSENVLVYNATTHVVEADIQVAGAPVSLAITPDGQHALSANTSGNTVSLIDLTTLTKVADIPLSRQWPFRVKVTPDGQHAVVATADDAYVVVSLSTMQEVRAIPSPGLGMTTFSFNTGRSGAIVLGYTDFDITPDSSTLVAQANDSGDRSIRLYDLASGTQSAALPVTTDLRAITLSADGSKAYLSTAYQNPGTLVEVDLTTETIARTLTTEQNFSQTIILTPDEQFLIAAGLNKILFIDLADGSTDATAGAEAVSDIALSYDGKYVLSRWVVDVPTRAILATLPPFSFLETVATSPVDYRGIQATQTGGHHFAIVNIDGANAALEATLPGGEAPEGDSPTAIAITPDGLTAVTANWESDNATIIDLANQTAVAWVDVGTRPDGVAITPDGTHALLSSPDDDSLSIIDLTTQSVVSTLVGLADDPRHIVVSSDSGQAFVSTTGAIDGMDKVYFVDLDGGASSLTGSLSVGDIATEIAQYTEMTLSPDSSLLAVPLTRDDELVLIDTTTHTEIARLPTGDFPMEAEFSPTGDRLYVMNEDSNSVTVIHVDGSNSTVQTTVTGLAGPSSMALGAGGDYLYVASYQQDVVEVIDTRTLSVVHSVATGSAAGPWKMHRAGNVLYLVGSEPIPVDTPLLDDAGHLMRIVADGPSSRLVDDLRLSGRTRIVDFSDALRSAITVTHNNDGIDIVPYEAEGDGDNDYYRFLPQVGDAVVVSTLRPGSGSGHFENNLDIAIELYDPNGTLIERNDSGTISHTIASLGHYWIRVYAQGFTEGEYLLSIAGVTQTTAPSVIDLFPSDGATEVTLDSKPIVTFDQDVVPQSGDISIMRTADNSLFAALDVTGGQVTFNAGSVTIDPGKAWEVGTGYYVLVDAGAIEDLDGNDFGGISDKTLWNFTVGFGLDFGDAPAPYPVTTAEDGARHEAVAGLTLGPARDTELNGLHSADADADDLAGTTNDEDGVTFGSIRVGQVDASVTVNVQGASGDAKLDAWIDFNNDGTWGGTLEQIADSLDVSNGDNEILFDVPHWTTDGTLYARFRVSSAGDLGVVGYASDGEAEDHAVTILPPAAASDFFSGQNVVTTTANNAQSIFPVDLDGDGDMDVIASRGTSEYLVWHENDGAENFTERIIGNERFAWKVSVGDLDGDNDIDVLSTQLSGNVVWHENLGAGNFADHFIDTTANTPDDVFAVDMDNDGDLDVVVLETGTDTVFWYENNGSQVFTKIAGPTGVTGVSMFVIDVDSDGDHDLISNTNGITWYRNDAGTFAPQSVTTNSSYRISAADVDSDGDVDVLSAAYNQIAWYENTPGQVFTHHKVIDANQAYAVSAADLDGDGDVDLISDPSDNSNDFLWHENDGLQNFTQHLLTTQVRSPRSPLASDLDGDGDLDVLVSDTYADQVNWYENQTGIPPLVVSLLPADDSAVIATQTNLEITFDQDVQKAVGNITIRRSADDSVFETIDVTSAAVTAIGSEVTINPFSDLEFGTDYYIEIDPTALEDLEGNKYFGIESSSTWNFTTLQSGRDYGDAPDTSASNSSANYNTLASHGGPSHVVTPGLYLGYTVDADDGSLQSTRSNADDADQLPPDDEDGLNDPANDLQLTIGAQPTVNVVVTNTTGTAATLSGWIDYDDDGVFDTTERAQTAVPSGSQALPVMLTFPTIPEGVTGTTYARFRLGPDAAAANPIGASSGGEVEDYVAQIFAPSSSVADSTAKIGHQVGGGPTLVDSDYFGSAIAALGDIDGDGVEDIAIGSEGDDTGATSSGAIYIARMNADGSIKSYNKITKDSDNLPLGSSNYFGTAITSMGDLDGDGVTDLAALTRRTGGATEGSVHFLYLNADGTLKDHHSTRIIVDGNKPSVTSLAAIGDVDGDGVVDLAIGSYDEVVNDVTSGAVLVMLVNRQGTAKGWQMIGHQFGGGPSLVDWDQFGQSVASVGDLDRDGVPDLAVGAIGDDTGNTNAGAVYLLLLNRDGSAKGHHKIAHQTGGGPSLAFGDQFGSSLGAAGDLNADGVTDLIVGASQDDTGQFAAGAAYVLRLKGDGTVRGYTKLAGNTGGVPPLPDIGYFGDSVTSIGDLNDDGSMDLAVGAPWDSTEGTRRGIVHVVFLETEPLLGVAITPASMTENGSAVTGTVTRKLTSDLSQPLTVTLASDDTSEATVPVDVTILADQASADFTITIQDDDLWDGSQAVEISGASTGYVTGYATLDVLDNETADFGDAPPPYPTLLGDDGAIHVAIGPRLGPARDGESEGQPSAEADADDDDDTVDDEDGVVFGGIAVGGLSADVDIYLENAASAKVDAWIDFDRDGTWAVSEKILDSVTVDVPMQSFSYSLPGGLTAGTAFARVRLSTEGNLDPTGLAADGEVEDYMVHIVAPPAMEHILVHDGAVSRSQISVVAVTFDTELDHASLADAFTVTNIDTLTEVGTVNVSASDSGGKTTAVLTFAGASTVVRQGAGMLGNSLEDGNYRLDIHAAYVKTSLGNIAMTENDVFGGQTAGQLPNDEFFRLLGDTDGNGYRNGIDLNNIIPTLFNPEEYRDDLDTNGDGYINGIDLNKLIPTLYATGRQ